MNVRNFKVLFAIPGVKESRVVVKEAVNRSAAIVVISCFL